MNSAHQCGTCLLRGIGLKAMYSGSVCLHIPKQGPVYTKAHFDAQAVQTEGIQAESLIH